MVRDINAKAFGKESSNTSQLTVVGNTLFFTTNDGYGVELWKSGGTSERTKMVKKF